MDAAQVVAHCRALAEISEEPGRLTRPFASPAMSRANAAVGGWMAAAGLRVRQDAAGNLVGRLQGSDPAAGTLLLGSHLDTVRDAGAFDGPLGVLVAVAALGRLTAEGRRLPFAVDVLGFADEEGLRFGTAYLGSRALAGTFDDALLDLVDAEGVVLRDALAAFGGDPAGIARAGRRDERLLGYCEVHIEQGPVLEQRAKTIGVVTGVQHMSRHEVIVEGQEAHAGPTPMDMRRDPIRVLADLLPALYAAAERRGRDARLTFGFIETLPGSPNTVPGRLRFTVDIRHPDARQYTDMREEMNRLVHAALERHGLMGDIRCVWEAPGVSFDPMCVAAVRSATAALGLDSLEMVSGAGHDSCNVSAVVPTAMVFVPCAGGLSHNEAESALPGDLEAGANVLLHAMLSLAMSVPGAASL
jgi:allantoate deiminase